jgi:hypothetical protein
MAGNVVSLVFAGDSKSLEKTFDKVGAGAKEMAKDFDKAEAKSKSFGKAMDKTSDSVGKGETAFMGTADILDGLGGAFGLPTEGATNMMRAFGDLGGGFSSITGLVGKLGGSFSALAMGPVGLIIAGVAALAVGIIALYKNSETFREIVSAAFEQVKKVLGPIIDGIGKAISWVTGLFSDNKKEVEKIPDVYKQAFEDLKVLLEANRQKWQAWKDGVTQAIDNIMNPLQRARDQSKLSLDEIKKNLEDNIAFYQGWINNLNTLTERGFGDLATTFYQLGPTAEKAVGEMVGKSDKELTNLADLFTKKGTAATNSFLGSFLTNESLNAMGQAGIQYGDRFKKGFDLGTGSPISVPVHRVGPAVPHFAEGGIVTGPTLAMIGEKGPEAVVPLGRGAPAAGGNITVNVYGTVVTENQLVDAVHNGLLRKQRRSPLGLSS